jgi:hypothetical protein
MAYAVGEFKRPLEWLEGIEKITTRTRTEISSIQGALKPLPSAPEHLSAAEEFKAERKEEKEEKPSSSTAFFAVHTQPPLPTFDDLSAVFGRFRYQQRHVSFDSPDDGMAAPIAVEVC